MFASDTPSLGHGVTLLHSVPRDCFVQQWQPACSKLCRTDERKSAMKSVEMKSLFSSEHWRQQRRECILSNCYLGHGVPLWHSEPRDCFVQQWQIVLNLARLMGGNFTMKIVEMKSLFNEENWRQKRRQYILSNWILASGKGVHLRHSVLGSIEDNKDEDTSWAILSDFGSWGTFAALCTHRLGCTVMTAGLNCSQLIDRSPWTKTWVPKETKAKSKKSSEWWRFGWRRQGLGWTYCSRGSPSLLRWWRGNPGWS